jgi:hypothetical protein
VRFPITHPRSLFRRETVRDDAMSGVVLGVESVPDGLASGLLAGVNPVAGLYACLFGVAGAALFTSTAFMAVQGTGAMAIIVADVDLGSRDDPLRALYTLSVLTGLAMIVAGFLRLGSFPRFVSNSVMTGFITAVGVNIVLGQLDDFTGYDSSGDNRVARAVDLVVHIGTIGPLDDARRRRHDRAHRGLAAHPPRRARAGRRGVRRLGARHPLPGSRPRHRAGPRHRHRAALAPAPTTAGARRHPCAGRPGGLAGVRRPRPGGPGCRRATRTPTAHRRTSRRTSSPRAPAT